MTQPEKQRACGPKRATSPSMEQYIETIADLLKKDKVCSVSEIAEEARVSRPAASRAVRELKEKNLVDHKAYGYVDLTPMGQSLADKLTARHEALFSFLSEVLGFDTEWADREACRLEHLLDDDLVDRLAGLTAFFCENRPAAERWGDTMSRFIE